MFVTMRTGSMGRASEVWMKLIATTFIGLMTLAPATLGQTVITNTRAEVAFMAGLWESDTIQISPLANAQYPNCTGTWQFIYPLRVEADADVHIRMGINSSAGCTTANNINNAPIIAEVVNVFTTSNPIWTHLVSLSGKQAKPTGIFRYYTEHALERHFEIHPVTQMYVWNTNSNAFVLDTDYHAAITNVIDGTTHSTSTLRGLFDGTETMTAVISNDNIHVMFTYPSPGVNYVQYQGFAQSTLATDSVSQYFTFQPTSPSFNPPVTIQCRIITNTLSATIASVLSSNRFVVVNALSRTDMLVVSNQIASMTAGQTNTFTRPVELITLGIGTGTPNVTGVDPKCGSPSGGTPITITGIDFVPGCTVTIDGVAATSVVYSNYNVLTAVTPAGTAGPKTVAVKTPNGGGQATLPNGFSYANPVSFTGVTNAAPAIEAATLTWSAATGTGVTYNVYEGLASGAEDFGSPVLATNGLSAFIAPLYPGSNSPLTYFFVVRATDACGNSESNSVEQSVQPLLDPNKSQVGDGIPNGWKQQYGFNPFDSTVAAADPDGDGMSNLQEFLAGTNPVDATSAFRILSLVADPSGDIVTWSASSNKVYQLQLNLDLVSGVWSNVGGSVTDDIGQATLSETNAVAPPLTNRFYRIQLPL